jgi:hypothetical protein
MDTGPIAGICCIDLSLRLFDGHLLIEVIDSSPKVPIPNLDENASATGGRGLAVVDNFSGHQWGYFWRTGRKVVFCMLPLTPLPTPRPDRIDAFKGYKSESGKWETTEPGPSLTVEPAQHERLDRAANHDQ